MEKRIRSEGDLPEEMIQHIQSFLSVKEAVQTTILSKSWYNACLTRPNLVINHQKYGNSQEFSKISKKTMQRYRDLNLKLDSFKILMTNDGHSLANELTVEAIKIGATDICLETNSPSKFVLPGDVLQSESLTRLSLTGCKMEKESVKVNFSTLKYLYLFQVFLEGYLFSDLISSCPLIEVLELRQCMCRLKRGKKLLNLSKGFELHKLKTLLLEKVKLCSLFFGDFSSRFPCLKDLSVHGCSGYKKIKIYSQSLEFISFVHLGAIFKADFDVPNLRKFYYSGESSLPSLSFPNSCNWESTVSISLQEDDHISAAEWFTDLNKLLRNLRLSKVSLNLKSSYYLTNIDKSGTTKCLFTRPLVENLTIDVQSLDCAASLLDSLIQWCRPVFITQNLRYYSSIDVTESQEILYKTLMQRRKSVKDLEEVSVEVFDEAVFGWQTIPWKSLQDTSTSRVAEQRIRLHSKWGQR